MRLRWRRSSAGAAWERSAGNSKLARKFTFAMRCSSQDPIRFAAPIQERTAKNINRLNDTIANHSWPYKRGLIGRRHEYSRLDRASLASEFSGGNCAVSATYKKPVFFNEFY